MNSALFTYLHNFSSNNLIANVAIFLDKFTYPILLIILIIALYIASRKFFTFSLIFLSTIFSWFIAQCLKFLFHTTRPFLELGIAPLSYESGFAFPSQHTAVFIAVGVSMFMVNRRFAIFLVILSIIIGISRVILGVHWPVDIIGGLALGSIVSFLMIKIFKKI